MAETNKYNELKETVETLVECLKFDLNTDNATTFTDYTGEETRNTNMEIAYVLGVYTECLSQAREHLREFEIRMSLF